MPDSHVSRTKQQEEERARRQQVMSSPVSYFAPSGSTDIFLVLRMETSPYDSALVAVVANPRGGLGR